MLELMCLIRPGRARRCLVTCRQRKCRLSCRQGRATTSTRCVVSTRTCVRSITRCMSSCGALVSVPLLHHHCQSGSRHTHSDDRGLCSLNWQNLMTHESVKPLQYYCCCFPVYILLPMKKLLCWKKMLCSGNYILCTLAKCCDASIFGLAAKFHIESHDVVCSSVARIKDSFRFYFFF